MKNRKRRQYLNRTLNPLGNRCSAFQPGCFRCESYKYFDTHGRFPTFDEADELASAGMKVFEAELREALNELKKQPDSITPYKFS